MENAISASYEKHFPERLVKVDKYKHKLSPLITTGIMKSIEFRDKLYKDLKNYNAENLNYELKYINLKIDNFIFVSLLSIKVT